MGLRFFCVAAYFFTVTLMAQGTLQFNQVKLISINPETVPVGKVWKVENIFVEQVVRYQSQSGTGNVCPSCNGSSDRWNSFSTPLCPSLTLFNDSPKLKINGSSSLLSSSNALWLSTGTVVEGVSYNCSSSPGSYNLPTNSCFCPSPQTVYSVISVIEFNVIP
jgi:hypothetical protein